MRQNEQQNQIDCNGKSLQVFFFCFCFHFFHIMKMSIAERGKNKTPIHLVRVKSVVGKG